jgi:hypothetical protein
MIEFALLHPRVDPDVVGFLPTFFSERDQRPAREQIDTAYAHGGGWRPQPGFNFNQHTFTMQYPGDPVFLPLARAYLRDELIILYEHEYLAIIQPDGSFEIGRVN